MSFFFVATDCTPGNPPKFEKFLGFYPFELNGENIADVSAIPGSSTKVAVIERNGFPNGNLYPAPVMPANKVRKLCGRFKQSGANIWKASTNIDLNYLQQNSFVLSICMTLMTRWLCATRSAS
jgi:hypothetical protein